MRAAWALGILSALLLVVGMVSGLDRTLDRCTVEPGTVALQLGAGTAVVLLAGLAAWAHRWPDRVVRNIALVLTAAAYLAWLFIRTAAYSC